MVVWVTEAKALPGFRLWLRFSDGSQGEVALREFIESDRREIVRQLRDPAVFCEFRRGCGHSGVGERIRSGA